MTNDKMREEFEEWFLYNYSWFIENEKSGYSLVRFKDSPCQYEESIPHHDWRVWQASRAALVIELPDTVANTGTLTSMAVLNYKNECRLAITKAGVSYK